MASTSRNFWTEKEVLAMLNIFVEKNINSLFDGRRFKNNEIYKMVYGELCKLGHSNKSIDQIKNKWKALKSAYYACIKSNNKSGEIRRESEYFQLLDEILGM